jgi:hypothetical protein
VIYHRSRRVKTSLVDSSVAKLEPEGVVEDDVGFGSGEELVAVVITALLPLLFLVAIAICILCPEMLETKANSIATEIIAVSMVNFSC